MIYEHVADAEKERFVLGRRFVEAHKDGSLSLDERFDEAVAPHALSMTCRQMQEEFQLLYHFRASEDVRWVLVVNNFEIDQIERFAEFVISGGIFEYDLWDECCWPEFVLRLQMDSRAVRSAVQFCDYIRKEDRLSHMTRSGRDNEFR